MLEKICSVRRVKQKKSDFNFAKFAEYSLSVLMDCKIKEDTTVNVLGLLLSNVKSFSVLKKSMSKLAKNTFSILGSLLLPLSMVKKLAMTRNWYNNKPKSDLTARFEITEITNVDEVHIKYYLE